MVDADRFRVTGPIVGAIDPAPVGVGSITVSAGSDVPSGGDPPQTIEHFDGASLERLTWRIETLVARLETLVDLMIPPGGEPDAAGNDDSGKGISPEIKAAIDALIYTDFFQKAVNLGMSPNMVADAYRLADLTNVTANLETKEVTGTDETVSSLLESKPYLFFVHQADIGSETNPVKGASSYSDEVEALAQTLGVTPEFTATLVKKRSDKARGSSTICDIWRVPRTNRLSSLEIND